MVVSPGSQADVTILHLSMLVNLNKAERKLYSKWVGSRTNEVLSDSFEVSSAMKILLLQQETEAASQNYEYSDPSKEKQSRQATRCSASIHLL